MGAELKDWLSRHGHLVVGVVVGLAIVPIAVFVVDAPAVHPGYYAAIAESIPVVLLALLIRLAGTRNRVLETLDELTDEKEIEDLKELKEKLDGTKHGELIEKVLRVRETDATKLRAMAPDIFIGLIGVFAIAGLGEAAALAALASNSSNSLFLASTAVGLAALFLAFFNFELTEYRLVFVDRGMLFGWRGVKHVNPKEEFEKADV